LLNLKPSVPTSEPLTVEPQVVALIGPWGSGKTTILNSIQQTAGFAGTRVGVIFAEFGEVNVDASRISADKIVEVQDRCICCHGAEALATGINQLRSQVDLLLVETSGVSNGSNIRDVLKSLGLNYSILGTVSTAGFSKEDIDLLDAQLPVVDRVLLTHNEWLGSPPSLDDTKLAPLTSYLSGLGIIDKVSFAHPNRGIDARDWESLKVQSHLPDSLYMPARQASALSTRERQHHQIVLTVVLHPQTRVEQLQETLAQHGPLIERAKGVICDQHGVAYDFDYIKGRDPKTGEPSMQLTLSREPSRSTLLGGRPHVVLFSRNNEGLLTHSLFLAIGSPHITDERLEKAFSRYPEHIEYFSRWNTFPAYNKEGDRYYGVLYPIITSIDRIPRHADRLGIEHFWNRTIEAYLAWRIKGIEALDQLRNQGVSDAHLLDPENLLATNLLWHLLNAPRELSLETKTRIEQQTPAKRFFASMATLSQPPESGGNRELSPEFLVMIAQFAKYGLRNEGLNLGDIRDAMAHAEKVDNGGTWAGASERLLSLLDTE
jgi:G3E family GTPase